MKSGTSIVSWLAALANPKSFIRLRANKRYPRNAQPCVEALEDRLLLAVNITNTPTQNENEGTIAIDPSDPTGRRLFAASNVDEGRGLTTRYSINGGDTWLETDFFVPPDLSPCCDPQAAFDKFGNLYLVYITQEALGYLPVIAMSFDAGHTFNSSDFQALDLLRADQPSVATGPCAVNDQVVVMWRSLATPELLPFPGVVVALPFDRQVAAVAEVTGAGAVGSFTAPKDIPGSGGSYSADVEVGPDGEIIVT